MCLALFPFSVNAASIEDILGEWQSEKPMPFEGIEHIVISKETFQVKPQPPHMAKIENTGNSFKIIRSYGGQSFKMTVEEFFTLTEGGKLLRDYPNAGGSRTQVYYIRPPKSPDHQ